MFKRVFRLLSSTACLMMLTAVPSQASPVLLVSKSHRPAPLVSAMFLVLAGMGISMLFDKRE